MQSARYPVQGFTVQTALHPHRCSKGFSGVISRQLTSKKELKDAYKLIKFKIGVFQVRNTVNNKIFIDSSVNIDAIFNRFRLQLNFGSHPNSLLQNEWKQYGEEQFKFEILAEIKQSETEEKNYALEAKQLAEMYIDELQPFDDRGYHKKS